MAHLNRELAKLPQAIGFAFSPPAIPGIGTAGGVTFVLEDRAGKDIPLPGRERQQVPRSGAQEARTGLRDNHFPADGSSGLRQRGPGQGAETGHRPRPGVPDPQTFMGGYFINYFNRFGRQWQVYVQAEGEYRTKAENVGQFYVHNDRGDPVPLSAVTTLESRSGPEFTMRYNLYRSAPDQRHGQARLQLRPGDEGPRRGLRPDHAAGDGLRLPGHELPGKEGPGRGTGLRSFSASRCSASSSSWRPCMRAGRFPSACSWALPSPSSGPLRASGCAAR